MAKMRSQEAEPNDYQKIEHEQYWLMCKTNYQTTYYVIFNFPNSKTEVGGM